jgi:hypothetical protein
LIFLLGHQFDRTRMSVPAVVTGGVSFDVFVDSVVLHALECFWIIAVEACAFDLVGNLVIEG